MDPRSPGERDPGERLAGADVHVPEEPEDLAALRVVVKRGFTYDMADQLVHDLKEAPPRLEKQPAPVHDESSGSAFHH
jgi:glutamate decarboxylase